MTEDTEPSLFDLEGEKRLKEKSDGVLSFHEIYDAIVQKVQITDYINLKYNRAECPKSGNTSAPSFTYYPATDSWYCHKCGKGGNVINLHAHLNNLTYVESVVDLCQSNKIPLKTQTKEEAELYVSIHKIYKELAELCYRNLLSSKYYEIEKKKRGFSDETMKMFKIGLIDKDNIMEYFNNKYPKDLLKKARLINDKGNWYTGKRILYPYLNYKSEPVYFIFRLIDQEPDFMVKAKYVKLKVIGQDLIRNQLFGLNSLQSNKDNDILIITEGITDAISVIQAGFKCISPVTVRFQEKDLEAAIRYCKRYKKIIVINDSEIPKDGEKYGEGFKGTLNTVKFLLKNSIENSYIGLLPLINGNTKEDINSYLAKGLIIDAQHDLLQAIIDESTPTLDYFLNSYEEEYKNFKSEQGKINFKKEKLKELLEFLPKENTVLVDEVKGIFAKKFKMSKPSINAIIKKSKLEEQKKINRKKPKKIKNAENIYFQNRYLFEERPDGLWLTERSVDNEGNDQLRFEKQILWGTFELKTKTTDYRLERIERYSYNWKGKYFNTRTMKEMLLLFGEDLYEGTFGRNAVSNYVRKKAMLIQETVGEYLLGFNDGWKLPATEEKYKVSIITQTDYQRRAYENSRKITIKHSDKENKEIIELMRKFIDLTQTERIRLGIIIGWSIAAPFRESFIEFYKLFPILLLTGKLSTGKSYIEDFFIVHFYKIWSEHKSPSEAESVSRIEDLLSSTTYPINIQEIEKFDRTVISILKDQATGRSNFERKKNYGELGVSKPKCAPLAMDANDVPAGLDSPALNTKMIHLDMIKKVKSDGKWRALFRKLKTKNLFSLIFDYTENWRRDDVFKIFDQIEQAFLQKEEKEIYKKYSRLKEVLVAIKFGLGIFERVFDYNFNIKTIDLLTVLAKERRGSQRPFHDEFYDFCQLAISFDPTDRYNKYVSMGLEKNNSGDYLFTNINKTDFNRMYGYTYSMRKIYELVEQALEDKSLITSGTYRIGTKNIRSLKIRKEFF